MKAIFGLFGTLSLAVIVAGICMFRQDAPLKKVSEIALPDGASRFDYQSLDQSTGRLYLSHMGAGKLVIFDVRTNKIVVNLSGYRLVTGVLAVPSVGKVYASAAGNHEVVISDMKTNKVLARVKGARFPDGIAYAPTVHRVFVSDESGGADLVIDATTNQLLRRIKLGGEAGNTQYDPLTNRIWVAVQTRNEMVSLDPRTMKITGRFAIKGAGHPHGFYINSSRHLAYISCDGNNKLLVVDLRTMKVLQSFPVTEGPDVLAYDKGLGRLYVGCEGGAVDVFQATSIGLKPMGEFDAPDAHTVAVDQKTHLVYIALENVGGKPELYILKPAM